MNIILHVRQYWWFNLIQFNDRFDKDRSGNIDSHELQQAFNTFGYQLYDYYDNF